jgi:hypothetical protein
MNRDAQGGLLNYSTIWYSVALTISQLPSSNEA